MNLQLLQSIYIKQKTPAMMSSRSSHSQQSSSLYQKKDVPSQFQGRPVYSFKKNEPLAQQPISSIKHHDIESYRQLSSNMPVEGRYQTIMTTRENLQGKTLTCFARHYIDPLPIYPTIAIGTSQKIEFHRQGAQEQVHVQTFVTDSSFPESSLESLSSIRSVSTPIRRLSSTVNESIETPIREFIDSSRRDVEEESRESRMSNQEPDRPQNVLEIRTVISLSHCGVSQPRDNHQAGRIRRQH